MSIFFQPSPFARGAGPLIERLVDQVGVLVLLGLGVAAAGATLLVGL